MLAAYINPGLCPKLVSPRTEMITGRINPNYLRAIEMEGRNESLRREKRVKTVQFSIKQTRDGGMLAFI